MKKWKEKLRKVIDIFGEVVFLYMLFVLFEISAAFMLDEPKIFVPTFLICVVLIFIDRFRNRKRK